MPVPGKVVAYLLLALAILATACAQIAFKHHHVSGRKSSLLLALAMFAGIPPLTYLAIRGLGVGRVYVFTSLSYALVVFLGREFFDEKVSREQLHGLALIVLGCMLYAF